MINNRLHCHNGLQCLAPTSCICICLACKDDVLRWFEKSVKPLLLRGETIEINNMTRLRVDTNKAYAVSGQGAKALEKRGLVRIASTGGVRRLELP